MKFKNILLMTMVGVMFGAAQASAAVITVDTTADEFDLAANGTCSLREAVESVNRVTNFGGCIPTGDPYGTNDEIQLAPGPGGFYPLTIGSTNTDDNRDGDLDIIKSVIITGNLANPPIIDGIGTERVFHIITPGIVVTFDELIITAGNDTDGGGIKNDGGTLNINNSDISYNTATNFGGGIYNGAGGTVRLSGTTVTNNNAVSGAGVFNDGATSVVNIELNSTFSDNIASAGGGAIYNYGGKLNISNSILNGSILVPVADYGGGIQNDNGGIVDILSSNIQFNGVNFDGGAIYNYDSKVTITDTTIRGNTAVTNGGGIYNLLGTVDVLGNSFIMENRAISGGGIYNMGSNSIVTLDNSTLLDNVATLGDGGGIYNNDNFNGNTVVLTNETVVDSNDSTTGYGGGVYNYGAGAELEITDNTVLKGNTSGIDGGAIYNEDGTLTLTDSFVGTSASPNIAATDGGGINNSNGTVNITNSIIEYNKANTGGGIANWNPTGVITIIASVINNNMAISGSGGGIRTSSGTTVYLTDSTIDGNSASIDGGGIHSANAFLLDIKSSTISGNNAVDGGGIHNSGINNNTDIVNSTISGNTATDEGGGIFNITSTATDLSSVTVALNTASAPGGYGLHVATGTVTIRNSIFDNAPLNCVKGFLAVISSSGYNLDIGGTCDYDLGTGDITGASALLDLLAFNGGLTWTHALKLGSPALDVGDTGGLLYDQRGSGRGKNGADDIGAFEFTSLPVISEVTKVPLLGMDTTPDYTFNTTKAGDITYGGSCASAIFLTATVGDNPITFDELAVGAYDDCTIRVEDSDNGFSNVLDVNDFVIQAAPVTPVVTGTSSSSAGGRDEPLTSPPPTTVQTADIVTASDDDEPEMRDSFFIAYFRDAATHWARRYIEEVRKECFLTGYLRDDGTPIKMFRPDRGISRAEFMVMVIKCKEGELSKGNKQIFFDLEATHWAAQYVRRAVELGIIKGFDDGTFRPNGEVTSLEALVTILLVFFDKDDINSAEPNNGCSDVRSSDWYYDHYSFALNNGIVRSGSCLPNKKATRAEIVEMLKKAMP